MVMNMAYECKSQVTETDAYSTCCYDYFAPIRAGSHRMLQMRGAGQQNKKSARSRDASYERDVSAIVKELVHPKIKFCH